MSGRAGVMAALLVASAAPIAAGQTVAERVSALPDGMVRLSYAVRGQTCWSEGQHTRWQDDCPCGPGVADAEITLARGKVVRLRNRVRRADAPPRAAVGAPPAAGVATDLGRLAGPIAAELLLALAARGGSDGEELVAAASIADSAVTWPGLLALARNTTVDGDTRRSAVFWLSQAAGEAATRGLDSIVADPTGDRDVREHAVFALSQRPADEAVPALVRVARTHADPGLRRKALFWLGQTDDPRAVALFEELLR